MRVYRGFAQSTRLLSTGGVGFLGSGFSGFFGVYKGSRGLGLRGLGFIRGLGV